MLRGIGLFDAELFDQLSGREFSISQKFNNRDPRRICETLKDFTLELPELVLSCRDIIFE